MNDEWEYSNPDYSSVPSNEYAGQASSGQATTGEDTSWLSQLSQTLGNAQGPSNRGLSGLLSGGLGLYDLFSHSPNSAQGINASAAQAADPFAGQRGQYQGMLQNMMTNPNQLLSNDPAFQARLQQGLKGVANQQAAQGYLGSGNMLNALQGEGQTMASNEMQNQYNRLALLSGVQSGSPASAGQILAGRYGQRNNAAANIGGALGMGQNGITGFGGNASSGTGLMGQLANLYGTGSKLSSILSGLSNGGSGRSMGASTGDQELGAGTGGAFDQWAAAQGNDGGSSGGGDSSGNTLGTASTMYGAGSKLKSIYDAYTAGQTGSAAAAGGAETAGATAAGGEAGAAGASQAGAGSAGLLALPLLAYMVGTHADEADSARQIEGANRTMGRFNAAGVAPDFNQLYSMSTPWKNQDNQSVMNLLANGGSLDQFAPQVTLNQDYANQLLTSNPQLGAQGISLHDLGGDFQRYAAFDQLAPQRQTAQNDFTQWQRQYMYAPRPGTLSATQGGG